MSSKLKPFEKSGLYRATVALGGLSELARALTVESGKPVSRQAVFNWRQNGRIPSWFIPHINKLTNIPLADLLEPFVPVQPPSDSKDI